MPPEYNLLPDSCHFSPFSLGGGKSLHFSYTPINMYCKSDIEIDKRSFVYVEMRKLDKDSLEQLRAMSKNSTIGPMKVFGDLPCYVSSQEQLDSLFNLHRMGILYGAELSAEREKLKPASAKYVEASDLLKHVLDEKHEFLVSIELITTAHNEQSGYDLKTKSINPS